jgi:hypothetical protein
MQYKISFIDQNGSEFLGTTNHFVTDGRYSLSTVHEVATDTKNKAYDRESIYGYNIRQDRFSNPIIKTVQF